MFASMETCFGLGLIVGPSVGGALYQAGGYILPFASMGSCLIVAACMTFFVLPSHYNQRLEYSIYSLVPIGGDQTISNHLSGL